MKSDTNGSAMLDVSEVRKVYGNRPDAVPAVDGITFSVKPGEFVSVVGPSGCGKTTLLKCMSGLLAPTRGLVSLRGEEITAPPLDMAIVFQDYSRSLFPWLTVRQNVTLPLKARKLPPAERETRASDALEAVGLADFGDHRPYKLSGGMQQRVAIARALAYRPAILLMDEPFASIDAQTRADLEDLTLKARHEFDVTVVFITHDIDEAVYMSDRVVVLSKPPSVVAEIVDVALARPRDQISTKEDPIFAHLRAHVFSSVKGSGGGQSSTAGDPASEYPPRVVSG